MVLAFFKLPRFLNVFVQIFKMWFELLWLSSPENLAINQCGRRDQEVGKVQIYVKP